ncbi:L-ribulose-5-phosphate 3-epimerase [Vibrio sp. SCSIO 43132]|uniref:L-ribulose-5-phosphate 3-epimerase n=1 Tax=Vibrio sp. SCSIO 43132 TaxID=2779363 RepID=UPI001CA97C2E|nr:L-ribulose-5-phosphate 3-epimerase [Vibrio sp. SCSIO 43132]UAB73873.1 L-ribulose-5-phosphate 3-epimerase [Vibrio sp. SCSIO 43132]
MLNSTLMRPRMGIYEKAMPLDWELPKKIGTAKSLGFDFIEMSVDESDERSARLNWNDSQRQTVRAAIEEHSSPIQSMCLSVHRKYPFGSADSKTREKAWECMERAIDLAYDLGIRTIQLAGYDVYYEPSTELSHQRFIEGMNRSAKLAEQAGVMMAVEIMETPYLNSLSKFEILKREVPSPFFQAYPDIGNITGNNYDILTELALSKHHIVQIHLKDVLNKRDAFDGQFRDLTIGDGEVDFSAVLSTMKKEHFNVPIVLEMWAKDEHWQSNIAKAQQSLNHSAISADCEPLFRF